MNLTLVNIFLILFVNSNIKFMEKPMTKVIIHPLRQLIIRENCLIGFEGQMCLDKLNKDLTFKATKYKKDGATHEEVLEEVKGTYGVPERGWLEMHMSEDMTIEDLWKKGMQELA